MPPFHAAENCEIIPSSIHPSFRPSCLIHVSQTEMFLRQPGLLMSYGLTISYGVEMAFGKMIMAGFAPDTMGFRP
jgi:hypothetical protein